MSLTAQPRLLMMNYRVEGCSSLAFPLLLGPLQILIRSIPPSTRLSIKGLGNGCSWRLSGVL